MRAVSISLRILGLCHSICQALCQLAITNLNIFAVRLHLSSTLAFRVNVIPILNICLRGNLNDLVDNDGLLCLAACCLLVVACCSYCCGLLSGCSC